MLDLIKLNERCSECGTAMAADLIYEKKWCPCCGVRTVRTLEPDKKATHIPAQPGVKDKKPKKKGFLERLMS